jgi:hypothetical protein
MENDTGHRLPTRNELSYRALFCATPEIRELANRLLKSGIGIDDEIHPLIWQHQFDSDNTMGLDTPAGRLIEELVASQPEEGQQFAEEMMSVLLTPPESPKPEAPAPEPVRPENELGTLAWKMAHKDQRRPEPPAPPKYYVPNPPKLSTDQQPIAPWVDDATNHPL